jgi:hypothetical protein
VEPYKVGVTFALNNLVTAELLRITEQLMAADTAAMALSRTLKGLSVGAAATREAAVAATAMGDAFRFASAEIDGVRAKMASLGAASASAGAASAAGGAGRRGGFNAWILGALSKPSALGAGYGLFKSIQGGLNMDDAIARSMVAMGMQVRPDYMDSATAKSLQSSIFNASTSWGVGMGDTEEAALQAMRALAPLPAAQRTALLPSLLNFAGAEAFGKHGTSMLEATEAAIGLAHQLRAYSPEQIEPLLGAFAKLSMASPQSLTQMSRASSYYLPLLTSGLGMDPAELMALGTAGAQMRLDTKAGTWLAQMFQAPFVADLTGKRQTARRDALEALGLVNHGQVVTRDPLEFLRIMAGHSEGMDPQARLRNFVAAFGQQGARAAAIFTDPAAMRNLMALAEGLRNAPTPDQINASAANSPRVQFHRGMSELDKALTQLGEALMPATTSGIKLLTDAIVVLTPPLRGLASLISGIANILQPFEVLAKFLLGSSGMGIGATGTFLGELLQGKGLHRSFQDAVSLVDEASGPPAFAGGLLDGTGTGGATGSRAPQMHASKPVVVQNVIHLDGREIARSTSNHLYDGLNLMPSTGSGFDGRLSLTGVVQ